MSPPRPALPLAVLAFVVFLPGGATALNPVDSCWKKELKAAAKLAGAVGICEAATALDAVDPAGLLDDCVAPARAGFESTWSDALAIASGGGEACDGLAASADVRVDVEDALADLRSELVARIPASAKAKVAAQLTEVLLSEAGAFVKASLKAESQVAKTGDHKKAKQKRRDKRNAFRAIWDDRIAWAERKGVAFALDSTGPIADLDLLVDGVRDRTQPFASKKGAREGIHVDAPVGDAPHTVRIGYFSSKADPQYEWHLGDGTVRTAGASVEHTYVDAGNYPVSVVRVKSNAVAPMEELARLEPPIRVESEALVLQAVQQVRDWRIIGHPHVEADGASVFVVRSLDLVDRRVRRHAPDGALELDIDLASIGLGGADRAISDAQGNIYLTGYREMSHNNYHALVAKLDPAGSFLWERTLSSTSVGIPVAVNSHLQVDEAVVSPGGPIYLALHDWSERHSTVAAVSADGVLLWAAPDGSRPASEQPIRGLALAANGDVLVLDRDGAVHRYAPSGARLWWDAFPPSSGSLHLGWYDDIVACADGGALLLRGVTDAPGSLLTRISAVGAVQWERRPLSDVSLESRTGGIAGSCEDRLFMLGSGSGTGPNSYSRYLVQLASDGNEVRRRRVLTDVRVHLDAMSVRMDGQGDVHLLANVDDDLPGGTGAGGPGYTTIEYAVERTSEVPSARPDADVLGGSAPLQVQLDAGLSGNANDSVADYQWIVRDGPAHSAASQIVATASGEQADVTLNNPWVAGLKTYHVDLTVAYDDGGQYLDDSLRLEVGPRPPPELADTWQQHAGPGGSLTQNLIIKGGPSSGSGSLRTFSYTHLGIDGSYTKFDWVRSGSSMTFQYKKVLFCDFLQGRWISDVVPGGTAPISLSHSALVMNGVTYLRADQPRKNSVPGGTPVAGGPCSRF